MTQSIKKPRLLIVEDDAITADLISHAALENGYVPVVRTTAHAARATDLGEVSAALLDLQLPDGDGFDVLGYARRRYPKLPCFVLTARDSAESAVSALKAGALDYFTKPFQPARVFASLREVVGGALAKPPASNTNANGDWKSPAMVELHRAAEAAAANLSPVLLIGQKGCGKRSLAAYIHSQSRRSNHPFASVDTRSQDPASLEYELFGGETGRGIRKRGKIEMTHGGTLFIQNIELLPESLQSRLVDALEMRVEAGTGGWSDFRLIASSEEPLEPLVEAGSFRKDLFYRLAVTVLNVPRLRDGSADILNWCDRILTEICLMRGCRRPHLTSGAKELILDHHWPGNLDELRKVLDHAVSKTASGIIGVDEVKSGIPTLAHDTDGEKLSGFARINDLERAALMAALEACNGNRRRAAKRLGVSIRTIYNMIARHALRTTPGSSKSP